MLVSDCDPVHPDVITITEIQEIFPSELSAVVSDDRVRDPKMENDALDERYCLLGSNLSQGPHLDPLSKIIDCDEQVGQAPGCFLEGSQKV
jgi:hypothetical protein